MPAPPEITKPFDCIVIGGGINGTGIVRDAAMRGLRVLLVEKNDLGAGTTAYSSRLIHGGLRYLETFEVDLVRESLRERGVLLKIAPHLVHPLPLGIPVYEESRRSLFTIQVGMILYDVLSLDARWPKHQILSKRKFAARFPGIQEEQLKGGAVYYDAQVNFPERLCVENTLAAHEHGAIIWTHAQVERFLQDGNAITGLQIRDQHSQEIFSVSGTWIVNASGPWVDEVLGLSHPQAPKIGPTKGTHIVVKRHYPDKKFSFPEQALYVEAQQDGRPFFILPWLDDYMLIGTTDLHYQGNLDNVIPSEAEINYLLAETQYLFPQYCLGREEVLFSYAGVRPLPHAAGKAAGQVTRKHIIHDHEIRDGMSGLLSIIGGKITTYRNLAQETVDLIGHKLGRSLLPAKTQHEPLPGGREIVEIEAYKNRLIPLASTEFDIPAETVSHLIDLYGSRFREVLALTLETPEWKAPICPEAKDIRAQVIAAVRDEFAVTVEDVLMRRTGISLREGVGLSAALTVARLMAGELGWDPTRIEAEVSRYTHKISTLTLPRKASVSLAEFTP